MSMKIGTRWYALIALTLLGGLGTPAAAAPPVHEPTWHLRWAPEADRDGLSAFEHVEDDRANSDPAGDPHIFVDGDAYRFTMNSNVRDMSPDRQRNELRGLRTREGHPIALLDRPTSRLTHSMNIQKTLKDTN